MTDNEVKRAVACAIGSVCAESPTLDFDNAHEQSTAHRLAVHLEPYFLGWDVDCEYDRDGQLQKRLLGIADCDPQRRTDRILPDIVIHHRGGVGRDSNLLVVEIKKRADEDACDRRKLELLTDPRGHYQYQLGLYINVAGGEFKCTWFVNGILIG